MAPDGMITQELSFGQVIAKTFELYRRNFVKYFILYLLVDVYILIDFYLLILYLLIGVVPVVGAPADATPQLNWLPGAFGSQIAISSIIIPLSIAFGTIAIGGSIRMTSDEIEGRPLNLGSAVRFATSKLIWMWALGIIVGIIVALGSIALIIPGIILVIMFCLSFPALLIGNAGVIGSLGRSRELVSHRWLKTFVIFLILFVILSIGGIIAGLLSVPFGAGYTLVGFLPSFLFSAFFAPIFPIAITVFYYSNLARMSPGPMGVATMAPQQMATPGMKFQAV